MTGAEDLEAEVAREVVRRRRAEEELRRRRVEEAELKDFWRELAKAKRAEIQQFIDALPTRLADYAVFGDKVIGIRNVFTLHEKENRPGAVYRGSYPEGYDPTGRTRNFCLPSLSWMDISAGGDQPRSGFDDLKRLAYYAGHPRDMAAYERGGKVYDERRGQWYPLRRVFKGLSVEGIGVDPCRCAPGGPGHQYKVGNGRVHIGPWALEPGELFDCPPRADHQLGTYLKAGALLDLWGKAQASPTPPAPGPEELLKRAAEAFRGGA